MKPLGLFVAVIFVLCAPLPAGDVYHPDSNPASGRLFGLPWTNQEVRYQALVPATALGGKTMRITDLAFATGAVGTFTSTQCEITMAHLPGTSTMSNTFAANLQKDKTVMFSGPVKWPCLLDKWCALGLNGTFNYNGVDRVVVEVRFMGGQGGVQCRSASGKLMIVKFINGPGSYSATTAGTAIPLLVPKLRLTYNETLLSISGVPSPGGTIDLDLLSNADTGLVYQVGSSFGTGPIPIDTRRLNLSPDAMLILSVGGTLPTIFDAYAGTLDAQGKARARIHIPSIPALKGVRIHSAFVTLLASAPYGVANISNTVMFAIQ